MTESIQPIPGSVRRKEFGAILRGLKEGVTVYFQPGPDVTMKYPCIVYQRDNASTKYADNIPYSHTKRYQVTLIDREPDNDVYDLLAALPLSSYSRHFETSGLHHDVFVIYH